MSEQGDCRRLKRARYHEWLRRRWMQRAMAAAEKRAEAEVKRREGSKA